MILGFVFIKNIIKNTKINTDGIRTADRSDALGHSPLRLLRTHGSLCPSTLDPESPCLRYLPELAYVGISRTAVGTHGRTTDGRCECHHVRTPCHEHGRGPFGLRGSSLT